MAFSVKALVTGTIGLGFRRRSVKEATQTAVSVDTLRFGAFIATSASGYHVMYHVLEPRIGSGRAALAAGFVAGLALRLDSRHRRSEVSLLAVAHALKASWELARLHNWLPAWLTRCSYLDVLFFMAMTSVLMYTCTWRPTCMRPSFYAWGRRFVPASDLQLTRIWTKGPLPGDPDHPKASTSIPLD